MKKLFLVSLTLIFSFSCVSKYSGLDIVGEYYNVGNAYLKLEDYDKAEEYYLKVLELDEDHNDARFNLAEVNMMKSDFNQARKNVDILLRKDRKNLKVKKLAAYLDYSEGNLEKALKKYRDVYLNGDVSMEVRENIVKLYYQLDKPDEAVPLIEEMLEESEDKDLYYVGGKIFQKIGDIEKSVSFLEASLELGNNSFELLDSLFDNYVSLSDYDNQKKIIKVQLSRDIEDKAGKLFKLASILLINDNDFSEGYTVLEEALNSGFNKKDLAEELLEIPDLIESDKIRDLFVEKGVLE